MIFFALFCTPEKKIYRDITWLSSLLFQFFLIKMGYLFLNIGRLNTTNELYLNKDGVTPKKLRKNLYQKNFC